MNKESAFIYLRRVDLALNVAAMVCALLVVSIILITMYIYPKVMDRLSIRFTLAISILDFVKAAVTIFYNFTSTDGTACTFVSFSLHWLSLIYLFFNVATATNLHLVFVLSKTFNPAWELYYWLTFFGSGTFLTILPISEIFYKLRKYSFLLVAGKLGLDEKMKTCEIRNRNLA